MEAEQDQGADKWRKFKPSLSYSIMSKDYIPDSLPGFLTKRPDSDRQKKRGVAKANKGGLTVLAKNC